jgi:Rps23 Pro-64 3,4-dihydroxylase Tpa1-like proline 4-hydroxylase
MLNLQFLSNKEKLKQELHEPVVIIKNALVEEVAEKLYQELSESELWFRSGAGQDKSTEYHEAFSYDRNNIDLHDPAAPATVTALYNYLSSQEVMNWFSDACGRQCDSFRGSATNFTKGDHISEHNDLFIYEDGDSPKYKRVLTFNYYLSKGWSEDWGGNLVWKKPHKVITPDFNTLVLFNVTTNSYHWVDPVLKDTVNKRLSITGWYLQEIKKSKFSLAM